MRSPSLSTKDPVHVSDFGSRDWTSFNSPKRGFVNVLEISSISVLFLCTFSLHPLPFLNLTHENIGDDSYFVKWSVCSECMGGGLVCRLGVRLSCQICVGLFTYLLARSLSLSIAKKSA